MLNKIPATCIYVVPASQPVSTWTLPTYQVIDYGDAIRIIQFVFKHDPISAI